MSSHVDACPDQVTLDLVEEIQGFVGVETLDLGELPDLDDGEHGTGRHDGKDGAAPRASLRASGTALKRMGDVPSCSGSV